MSVVDGLKRLSENDVAFAIGAFLSVVAPGFLILQLFRPDLIVALDTFKLVLLAAALTLPIVGINYLAIAAAHPWFSTIPQPRPVTESDRKEGFFISMTLTFIILHISLPIAYLFGFRFKTFLLIVTVLQIIVFLLIYRVFRGAKKRNL